MKLNRLPQLVGVVLTVLMPLALLGGDQLPFKATLASTNFSIVFPGLGDTGRCAALDTSGLPAGTGWGLITITAVGNSNLMGLVTDVQSHCTVLPLDPNAPPPPAGTVAPAILGMAVITGANGDSIIGHYNATLTVTEAGAVINGQLTTTDGTGRFVGAKGNGSAFGVQNENGAALTLTGTLTSVGALKKH